MKFGKNLKKDTARQPISKGVEWWLFEPHRMFQCRVALSFVSLCRSIGWDVSGRLPSSKKRVAVRYSSPEVKGHLLISHLLFSPFFLLAPLILSLRLFGMDDWFMKTWDFEVWGMGIGLQSCTCCWEAASMKRAIKSQSGQGGRLGKPHKWVRPRSANSR